MIIDGRTLPGDEVVDTDVCIVGAGPAGLTIALELAGTGAKVLVLESGGRGWTVRGKVAAGGENVNPHYYRLEWTRVRAFGGSSWAWRHGLRCRPLEQLDLVERPEIDRGGWPIPYQELEAHRARASELCGLVDAYDTASWVQPGAPDIPSDPDLATSMFPVGPHTSFTGLYDRLNRLDNVTCMLHATVLELLTDDSGGLVRSVRVAGGAGRRFSVRASTFVLALGGIENARVLLLSRSRHPEGLGNQHDVVGRYFMEHPHVRTGVLHPAPLRSPEDFGLLTRIERDGASAIGFLRPTDETLRREGLLGSAWALHPANEALVNDQARAMVDLEDTARSFWRITPGTGRRLATVARRPAAVASAVWTSRRVRRGQVPAPLYRLLGMAEQWPNRESRVVLGTRTDRFGQPVARLDWRLTELDHRSLRRTQEVMSAALQRTGMGVMDQLYGDVDPPPLLGGGYHHMGTTRMDPDPRRGVVDTDARVHGLGNLFVAGSSVFPTSGFANPTLTLVAMAARLAAHLSHSIVRR